MGIAKNIIVVNEEAVAHAPVLEVGTPSRNARVVVGIKEAAELAKKGDFALEEQIRRSAKACLIKDN